MAAVAALVAKRPVVEGLTANIEAAQTRLKISMDCASAELSNCGEPDALDTVERSSKERNAIMSDLSSKLLLSQVYFGPKTFKAVKDLGDPWQATDAKLQALTQAMADELSLFEGAAQ
ncbi:hypothetical protein B9Y66_19225 [Stenotrophomonas maltophilia]|nr:hypothetical protein B9Y66_19225 [Stenotrophomonas maltophilia]